MCPGSDLTVMMIDARDSAADLDRRADFIIVGAGIAGITLALELAARHSVILLESGGTEADRETQSLYDGESIGLNYSLLGSRLRFLGGTSNHWGGWCGMLDDHDFETRDWVPHSGWPIALADIAPFQDKTADILDLGSGNFETEELVAREDHALLVDGSKVTHRMMRFSNPVTRMGEKYRNALENTPGLSVLLHANLVDLRLHENGSTVNSGQVRTLNGRSGRITAKHFILACGGLENARLLLACRSQARAGLGNDKGLVGRFFMEHPHVTAAELFALDQSWCRGQMALRRDSDHWFGLALAPTEESLAHHRCLNFRGQIFNVECETDEPITLRVMMEQAPNPNSRLRLSGSEDALGLPKIELDWRLNELDWHGIQCMGRLVGEALGAQGLGRVKLRNWVMEQDGSRIGFGSHHMGTTRMADDPAAGVVDRNCRVFGTSNLFVAGSSVFATGGAINPTFTLTALALRLAEHLTGLVR